MIFSNKALGAILKKFLLVFLGVLFIAGSGLHQVAAQEKAQRNQASLIQPEVADLSSIAKVQRKPKVFSAAVIPAPLNIISTSESSIKLERHLSVGTSFGVAPFTYSWDRTKGTRSFLSDFQSVYPTISVGLNKGDNFSETWTVTVRDAEDNIATADAIINFKVFTVAVNPKQVKLTADLNKLASKEIVATPSGGDAPFTYNWVRKSGSGDTKIALPTAKNPTVEVLFSGSVKSGSDVWTVTVTDAKGVKTSTDVVIDYEQAVKVDPLQFTAHIDPVSIDFISNVESSVRREITVIPNLGTAPYTYSWAHTKGNRSVISDSTVANPSISADLKKGDNFNEVWTVTVKDAMGLTATAFVNVKFKVFAVNVSPNPLRLSGDLKKSVIKEVIATPIGGDAPYIFNWVRKSGPGYTKVIYPTVSNPDVGVYFTEFVKTSTDVWTVTVTDANGTTASSDLVLNYEPTPKVLKVAINPNPAVAQAYNNDAFVDLTANVLGGTQPYSYIWTRVEGNRGVNDYPTQDRASIHTRLNPGENFTEKWKVTVTDKNNQKAEAIGTINFKNLSPTILVKVTPNPLVAGQRFDIFYEGSDALDVNLECVTDGDGFKMKQRIGVWNSNDSKYKGVITSEQLGYATADRKWGNSPSTCTWTAIGLNSTGANDFSYKEIITTGVPLPPVVNLAATSSNVRVANGKNADVTFVGNGNQVNGRIVKLELFKDSGTGYATTPVQTTTGSTSNVAFNYVASLTAGSYRFKLRATNQNGMTTDSTAVVVNVVDSLNLLGEINGIRSNNSGKLELFGWSCQDADPTALSYAVYANAPATLGGTQIASGVANISTENNNSAIQAQCHTPTVGHHFVVDLNSYAIAYAGKPLFVEVQMVNGTNKIVLPCADNSCTMPGALRIGLTTPQNNDRYTGPAIVFMRAKVENGSGSYDELAFNLNGEWITATPDGEAGTYSAMKTGVPSRATPYPVVAKVRQGNTTIYSGENLIYVDAINAQVTVAITTPAINQNVNLGTSVNVQASANLKQGSVAQIQTVKFKINGTLVANQIDLGSGNWKVNWTPAQLGVATIIAQAFDSNGGLLGESPAVHVNVGGNSDLVPASATPIPINIVLPYVNNSDAGSLPGSLGVDKNGSANYSIPIALPPGTAGMVPSLSLNYSSDNTTGSAGLGWSLGGISNIDRCGKTVAVDGVADAVRFETAVRVSPYNVQPTDRLCLDGQRLILVNGDANDNFAFWANGAEYRTEIESFNKITAIVANGKRAFKVENKAGQVNYYGNTGDSYIAAVGRQDGLAHRWRLSRSIDRSGNSIDYYYQNDATTGESKPSKIRWGGQTANLLSPNDREMNSHYAGVDFAYASRPDKREAYIAGARNDENLRLETIITKTDTGSDGNGGTIANRYKLGFELSSSSGRSLLKTLQICDAGDKCLPATTFSWGTADASATKGFIPLGGVRTGPDIFTYSNYLKGSRLTLEQIIINDFNGDGKSDILERFQNASNNNRQRLFTSNADGTNWDISYPFSQISESFVLDQMGDFDGDGQPDALIRTGSLTSPIWKLCLAKNRVAQNYICNIAVTFPQDIDATKSDQANVFSTKDYNADGKDDLFFVEQAHGLNGVPMGTEISYKCISTGSAFNCLRVVGDIGNPWGFQAGTTYTDVDGDGRVDQVRLGKCKKRTESQPFWDCAVGGGPVGISVVNDPEPGQYLFSGTWLNFGDNKSAVLPPATGGTLNADLSADGYSDMVFGRVKFVPSGSGFASTGAQICYSKGNGDASCKDLPESDKRYDHQILTVADFDGDGISDVLRPAVNNWQVGSFNSYLLCKIGSSGNAHSCQPWSGPEFKDLNLEEKLGTESHDFNGINSYGGPFIKSGFLGDFDGDGKPDILTSIGTNQWQIHSAADQAKPGEALDKLISVTNGLGLEERVTYAKANDTTTVQATATLPNGQDAVKGKRSVPHRQVVKTLNKSTGNGYWLDTNYTYAGYAVDGQGRGSLGFAKVTSYNVQSNISSTTWYSQEFPHTGTPLYQQTMSGQGGMGPSWYLSESTSTPGMVTYPQQNGKVTYLSYITTSTVTKRDLDSSMIGTTVSTTSSPDSYGNSSDNTVTTSNSGEQFVTTQSFIHTQKVWPLSQLGKVTESKRVGSVTAPSRTVDYTYDANGLVATETKQKGYTAYEVKTTYDRSGNNFGLVNKTTISYRDPVVGDVTKVMSEVSYTNNGRFPVTVKNALGHYETKAFDARNGAPVSNTDINGLITNWQVDGFGRKLKQMTPDGTDIYTYQKRCMSQCPSGAVSVLMNDTMRGADRVAVPSLVFNDSAGHPIRSITWGFDGNLIGSQITYDTQGRVFESYQARYINDMVNDDVTSGAFIASRNHYDDLNRVTQTDVWDEAGLKSTYTTYRGLVTEFKNVKNQIKTDTKDVWGRLKQSVDANSGITQYEHDPYNNLTKTTDPKFNVVKIDYDDVGRRIKLSDPDLGVNDYVLNPIGQVIRQTSPVQRRKSAELGLDHSTTIKYDDLGRMIERNESDLKGRWTYDNPAGQNCRSQRSCGKLVESYTLNGSNKDNQQTHTYDNFGRPSTTTLQRDTSYVQRFEYDAWGRPLKETQQRGIDTAKLFERRYNGYGYQYQILRGISTGYQVLWQANEQDASQRLRKAALGNFLRTDRAYYATTGRLQSATLMSNTGTQQLFENYSYDALGNVSERSQQWAADSTGNPANSFIELFSYDGLNRLATASVTGYATQVFQYDSIGNIESKTGVGNGNYAYPASGATSFGTYGASNNRPHAVQSIPGFGSFTYDDNGNLKNGAGRDIDWTSFDMPVKITKDNDSSTFAYGADHQRTKQIKSDGGANTSTIYYAGAMEVETKGGGVQSIKTYWPGGIGFETDKPAQATELNWTHTDRLGSVIAISNAGGTLAERLAYDSWGKRRSLSGNETLDSIDGVKDNKGFTGHEMLDKLDLVHMNGRIYDPLIARFMSADPIIQDPEHSQSYNRYTYVWNNPTNLTDPTGFMADDGAAAAAEEAKRRAKEEKEKWNNIVFKKLLGPCDQNSKCIGTKYADGVFIPSEQKQNQGADKTGTGATNSVVKAGVDGTRNFIDGGYGEKFSQSFANGNYGDATGFLVAGTVFSFINAITFGEVGAVANTTRALGTTIAKEAAGEVAANGMPIALRLGQQAEAGQLAAINSLGKISFTPTAAQIDSAAFKLIVGDAKFTASGKPVSTIFDGRNAAGLAEIKNGSSMMGSSYQARLQTYGSLVNNSPLTIYTSRPVNTTFMDYLTNWGVSVKPLPK